VHGIIFKIILLSIIIKIMSKKKNIVWILFIVAIILLVILLWSFVMAQYTIVLVVLVLLALTFSLALDLWFGGWLYKEGRFWFQASDKQIQEHTKQQVVESIYISLVLGVFMIIGGWQDRFSTSYDLFFIFWLGVLLVISGMFRLLNRKAYVKGVLKWGPQKIRISTQISFVLFVVYIIYLYLRYSFWLGEFLFLETILVVIILSIIGWLIYRYRIGKK